MPRRPDPAPVVAEVVWRRQADPDGYCRLLGVLFAPTATEAHARANHGDDDHERVER